MRKPLSTTIPEELISQIDAFIAASKGDFTNRSHLVEQAIRAYIGGEESLFGGLLRNAMSERRATATGSSLYETTMYPRMSMNVPEKRAIVGAAVELVGTGSDVFVDGSTTCIMLARRLAEEPKGLTVVTNSALICLELSATSHHRLVGVGGDFDSATASYTGSESEESVRKLHFDAAFVSTKGVLPGEGTFESNAAALRVKQVAAARSDRVVLLVDHSKIGQRSLQKVLDISEIDVVVTDSRATREQIGALRDAVGEVVVADIYEAPAEEDARAD